MKGGSREIAKTEEQRVVRTVLVAVVVGVLASGAIVIVGLETGREVGGAGLSVCGLTLEEAIKRAEGSLSAAVLAETEERFSGRLYKNYRAHLRAGRAYIFGRPAQAMTVEFASHLCPAHREQWLRECLKLAKLSEVDLTTRRKERWPLESTWEAIYNLTDDEALKDQAFAGWSRLESARYLERLASYRRCRENARKSRSVLCSMQEPGRERIRIWSEP